MKFFFETAVVTEAEATSKEGCGNWGVSLSAADANLAWECPMQGDGGITDDRGTVTALLARYNTETEVDPSEGPDELLYKVNGVYYLTTISAE